MSKETAKDEAVRKFTHDHIFTNDPSVNAEQTDAGKAPGTNVVVWREGRAPDIDVPQQVVISGTIKAPGAFLDSRIDKGLHDKNKAHVVFDREAFLIVLTMDETYEKGTRIEGKLELHPKLVAFGINSGTRLSHKQMFMFFRENRMYFSDETEHKNLIAKLSDYHSKLETELRSKDDLSGNTLTSIETRIMTNEVPMSFGLTVPIFKGEPKKKFRVELLVDVSSRAVQFVLDSIELRELIEAERDLLIDEQIGKFKTADILVIEGDCSQYETDDE